MDAEVCLNCKKPPEACDTCDPLSPGWESKPLSTDPRKVMQREASKRYRARNREKTRIYAREYRRKRPGYYANYMRERRRLQKEQELN